MLLASSFCPSFPPPCPFSTCTVLPTTLTASCCIVSGTYLSSKRTWLAVRCAPFSSAPPIPLPKREFPFVRILFKKKKIKKKKDSFVQPQVHKGTRGREGARFPSSPPLPISSFFRSVPLPSSVPPFWPGFICPFCTTLQSVYAASLFCQPKPSSSLLFAHRGRDEEGNRPKKPSLSRAAALFRVCAAVCSRERLRNYKITRHLPGEYCGEHPVSVRPPTVTLSLPLSLPHLPLRPRFRLLSTGIGCRDCAEEGFL